MYEPKRASNEPKLMLGHIPHGVDPDLFKKADSTEEINLMMDIRAKMFQATNDDVKFVVLYNSRNIRRKMTGDVILAFQKFVRELPEEERKTVRLILHTQPRDENGTDLPAIIRDIASDVGQNVVFSHQRVDTLTLNRIYNIADVIINLASNEGFGISTLEGMLAEKMTVANVTGGLQDQMGFRDEKGEYLHEDVHYQTDWGSNSDGKYKEHGEWANPIWPNNFALNGSIPTPYIFDSRCDWREAAQKLREVYDLPKEERARRGKLAREYALNGAFNSKEMCRRFMTGFDHVFENWKPRKRYGIYT